MVSDKKVFPTKDNKWVGLAHKPMIPDRRELEKVFKHHKEICLLHLPPAERKPARKSKTGNFGRISVQFNPQRSRRLGLLTAPLFQTDSAKRPRRGGAGLQRGRPLAVPEDLRDPAPVGVRPDHASDREPDAQSGRAEHGAPPGALHPEVPPAPRRAGPRLRRAAGEQHRREVAAAFLCAGQQSSGLCFCPHSPTSTFFSFFFMVPPALYKNMCQTRSREATQPTQRFSCGRKLGGLTCCCLELCRVFRK